MNNTLAAPARRRIEDMARFYRALRGLEERIGGPRRLAQCDGGAGWPERGVYIFFEHGELRNGSGAGPRVVRVGTHALKSGGGASLWSRLRGHRGDLKKGAATIADRSSGCWSAPRWPNVTPNCAARPGAAGRLRRETCGSVKPASSGA